jgi:hypothetical protein
MDFQRFSAEGNKSPAIWAVGMAFVTIAVVIVVVALVFQTTSSIDLGTKGNASMSSIQTTLYTAAGLFGVVGIVLVVSLLFGVVR